MKKFCAILAFFSFLSFGEEITILNCGQNRRIHTESGIIDVKENCPEESILSNNNNTRRLMPGGFSSSDKDTLISIHNQFRKLTAAGNTPNTPQASNMLENIWDDQLAAFAQEKVNKCVWEHSSNTERTNIAGYVGQYAGENLYLAPGYSETMNTLSAGLQAWYDEYRYYTYNPFYKSDCQSGQQCGHYTQMIWAKTSKVGCAYTICPSMTINGNTVSNAVYLSCNYLAGGNYLGVYPFVTGNTCSACPSGTKCVNGLCSSQSNVVSGEASTTTTTTKSPTMKPTTKAPTLRPTTKSPTTKSPTTKPTTRPTIKPTTKSPTTTTKSPTTTTKSPTTTTKSPTTTTKSPTTTTKSPTSKPTTKSPTTTTTSAPTTESPIDNVQDPALSNEGSDNQCCSGRTYCSIWNYKPTDCVNSRGCYVVSC